MQKVKTWAVTAVTVATTVGCATSPIPPSQATAVPRDRLIGFQDRGDGKTARLIVTRDTGAMGVGCYLGFWIDGELAARFAAGETAKFDVPSGERLVRVAVDPEGKGLCSPASQGDKGATRETVMRDGETKHFRLSVSQVGEPDVQRTQGN